jgi:pyruvate formate lyase activating enzyme
MTPALYSERLANREIRCLLCPHHCLIKEGKSGICRVRTNREGILEADNFGKLSGVHLDPVEKKPLYHFHPGKQVLSVGSVGCNLQCQFCQNCEISQSGVEEFPGLRNYSPEMIVQLALQTRENIGISYTYNEPTVFYEFMLETAEMARKHEMKNVMVSNGYIERLPLERLLEYMDACNIDLKGFNDVFYKKYTRSSRDPVLQSLKTIRQHNCHLEVTNLVIPHLNDNVQEFRNMVDWIEGELGKHTALHLSRYFPRYKMSIESTDSALLEKLFEIASEKLKYVYLGNLYSSKGKDTYCSSCGRRVIIRNGYNTDVSGLDRSGRCDFCKTSVAVR